MKKALFKVMAVTAAAIMFVCCCGFALAGCGEQTQTADVTGTVYSNGGSIVQYGDHVYFINGIPDYTDESGTSNVEGRVVKGGIYRAKIRTDRPASVDEEENKLISTFRNCGDWHSYNIGVNSVFQLFNKSLQLRLTAALENTNLPGY